MEKIFWINFIFFIIGGLGPGTTIQHVTSTRNVRNRCQPITVPICRQKIPYNVTMMPNVLGHNNQEEAGLEVHQFWPLIEIECSPALRTLLCSIYVPSCPKYGPKRFLKPCRSMCEQAKSGCEPLMRQYGFPWPGRMDCSRFPDEKDDSTCIKYDNNRKPASTIQPVTSPSRVENSCEPITVPLCRQKIPYNVTMMPNIFGHDNQEEAGIEVHTFWPLIEIECSPALRTFLCSIYVPSCPKYGPKHSLKPCRSICEQAREGCKTIMRQYGFPWPERMNCSRFPDESTDPTCVKFSTENSAVPTDSPS